MEECETLWMARLERCFDAARSWQQRLATPDTVTSGSSLAGDDKGLVTAPVRTAAWSGLLSAVDHLALMTDLARDELNMRPTSVFTPTRAALLGASQAVWVLSGNRATRRARALAIAEDERSQHRKFLWDYAKDEYAKANFRQEFMIDLNSQADKLSAEILRIRELRKEFPKIDSDATTMMREAAAHLTNAGSVGDQWMRFALAYEWRVASAAAHGRSWPVFVRKTEKTKTANGELHSFTTSAEELGRSVGAATLMTSEAWRLWDLRRVPH
ncbi:hypothetical protein FBY31_0615 [Arthrobacter sp. SLBN-100]|uniref:hypothetical protein n=1 Tax=Arthrobacter sp. SLBN-100 TaxID=2768450 RepID=UPI00115041E4|nr:hypothetical protein [Arthrobacter sp. SLBN-100]TQJ66579.1 hypothetical protein FBY31_0615 [Arthrobacter sp. SLBN-100]